MAAVSVIILVYKVEEYIEKCARSLFEQTLRDVEYVFVDDCTPDRSMEILERVLEDYPERRGQVKILKNEKNSGQAYSRRRGVEASTGKYTVHCDSDDWLELNMLERMYLEAEAYDADAVVCAWFKDDMPEPTKYNKVGENLRDFILDDMVPVGEMQSLWRYMVKREVYSRGVTFPLYNQGEDHAILVQLAYLSKSIYCVNMPLYHWRYNANSITNASSWQAILNRFHGACANAAQVESFLVENCGRKKFSDHLAALKLYCMFYLRPLLRQGEGIEEWRKALSEIKGKVLCNKHIKFAHKVEYLMVRYCPAAVIKQVYRWRKNSR